MAERVGGSRKFLELPSEPYNRLLNSWSYSIKREIFAPLSSDAPVIDPNPIHGKEIF